MRIIQVVPCLHIGGTEIMCENLTNALMDMGHQVTVASMYDMRSPITERLSQRGADVRYLSKKPGVDLSMIGKLKKLFTEEKPDVVHTHTHTIQYAAPAARAVGVPVQIHTVHSVAKMEYTGPGRYLEGFLFRRWGILPVALSAEVRRTVAEEYRLPAEAVPIVFNGIDLSRCMVKENYRAASPFVIAHVGRISEAKNHAGLIKAFALFREQFPDSKLKLVGDGELRTSMEELTRSLKLGDSVEFLGEHGSVYELLGAADVFAMPSNFEGMPMAIIEAMGSALPVVATAVGGIPDMIEDNVNGLLVDKEPAKIAQALARLASDEQLRRRLGRAALERAQQYSAKTMAESYTDIYEKRLSARSGC